MHQKKVNYPPPTLSFPDSVLRAIQANGSVRVCGFRETRHCQVGCTLRNVASLLCALCPAFWLPDMVHTMCMLCRVCTQEHRLLIGHKEEFHLEAFVAKCMSVLKNIHVARHGP